MCPKRIVDNVAAVFQRSSQKSVGRAERELQVPTSTTHTGLDKQLHLQECKLKIIQVLEGNDRALRYDLGCSMLQVTDANNEYLNIVFPDKICLHLS